MSEYEEFFENLMKFSRTQKLNWRTLFFHCLMKLSEQIRSQVDFLSSKGIVIQKNMLYDESVRRSILTLGKLLSNPASVEELLVFLLDKALANGDMQPSHLTFQSSLLTLTQHYGVRVPSECFSELRKFCQIASLRFSHNCIDFFRHCNQLNKSSIKSFGLFSARSIRNWNKGFEVELGVSSSAILSFLSDKSTQSMTKSSHGKGEILSIMSLDGITISPGVEIHGGKVYGIEGKEISVSEARKLMCDLNLMADLKFVASIEVFSLNDAIGNRFLPVAILPVGLH